MILVTPVAKFHAFEKLVRDVGIAGSSHKRREPVETGKDSILNRARLDVPGPARNARYAETAFADRALGVLERSHPAIRPGEHFRAVVCGEYNDRVISFADVVEVFQERTDA